MKEKQHTHIIFGLDPTSYGTKEQAKANIGNIRNRMRQTAAAPEELLRIVTAGQSFTPASLAGTGGDSWHSQQIIAADIDNDEAVIDPETGKAVKDPVTGGTVKRMIEHPCTPQAAADICREYGVPVFCMYKSFSYKETFPKFRIIIVLDEVLTDQAEAAAFSTTLNSLIEEQHPGATDPTNKDAARLYFGSTPDCIISADCGIASAENLRNITRWRKALQEENNRQKAQNGPQTQQNVAQGREIHEGETFVYTQSFDLVSAKNSFNLLEYVRNTSGSEEKNRGKYHFFNPCPICGHKDDFVIHEDTPQLFTCFGAGGLAGKGGSIIDYLMHTSKLDLGQAIAMFQYDILGQPRPQLQSTMQAVPTAATYEPIKNETLPDDTAEGTPAAPIQTPQAEELPKIESIYDYISCGIFSAEQNKFKSGSDIKTGFEELDMKLGGSLFAGLYCFGAVSSLGKTTFVLQLCDQIAERNHPVLFFSLEQSRLELVSKSIARTARKFYPSDQADLLTALDIRKGRTNAKTQEAMYRYTRDSSQQMHVIEGNFKMNILTIRAMIEKFIRDTGKRPVVAIDYLQVLQPVPGTRPGDQRLTTDNNIQAMKQITRDLDIPIIIISSLNRAGYTSVVDFESFKESGGIEYTCDCVLGMEYSCVEDFTIKDKIDERRRIVNMERERSNREITLRCLKNRYGQAGFKIYLDYVPKYDFFSIHNGPKKGMEITDEDIFQNVPIM